MAQPHHETSSQDARLHQLAETDRLYEQYAKPLEQEHRGEYIAVSPSGKTMLGRKLYNLVVDAEREFGPGNFIFKLGDKAAATWRWISNV